MYCVRLDSRREAKHGALTLKVEAYVPLKMSDIPSDYIVPHLLLAASCRWHEAPAVGMFSQRERERDRQTEESAKYLRRMMRLFLQWLIMSHK
jgi:hypothetical protein